MLSSITEFMFSIHSASTSPSRSMYLRSSLPESSGRLISRKILLRRPSVQSRVVGSSVPYNSMTVQAFDRIEKRNDDSIKITTKIDNANILLIIIHLRVQNVQFRRFTEMLLCPAERFDDHRLTTASGTDDHRRMSGHHHFVQLNDFINLRIAIAIFYFLV